MQINFGTSCLDVSFKNSMDGLLNTTIRGGTERIWFYQTCTAYGGYMTCDPDSDCLFTTVWWLVPLGHHCVQSPWLLTLEFNVEQCKLAYNITEDQVCACVTHWD